MPPLSSYAQHGVADDDNGGNDRTSLMISGFTSNLMESIALSKSKLGEWVKQEKGKADAAALSYQNLLRDEQTTIDSMAAELLAVQMERGMKIDGAMTESGDSVGDGQQRNGNTDNIAAKKQALEQQITQIQIEVMKLQTERDNRDRRVKDIAIEESRHRIRAHDARVLKEQAEEAKRTTVDDLTRGVVNYKYLGLDFEQTNKENELRFSFSQIDTDDPLKRFSFVLLVDEEEKYEIVDCNPAIDGNELTEIARELNHTEDMSLLVRHMRRAFQSTCF